MIKFLKRFLQKEDTWADAESKNNTISISLEKTHDYLPQIELNITDTSQVASQEFAKVLILLNSGVYASDIVDLLTELSSRNDDLKKFCTNTFLLWKAQLDTINLLDKEKNTEQDEPIIKPSNFAK